ncbi:MAG: ABC transporter ATP-binding protein [Bacillota bacterium]
MQEGVSIEVHDLHKSLKKNVALKGVSMNFSPRHIHGVIGPEGAGKTTLLRHLMGLLRADQGQIHYRENSSEVPFAEIRPRLAYMPQTQSLYAELSIQEHLEFFKILYNLAPDVYRERREKLLQITRLEEFTGRVASQLSGGMYKKLGLACALLSAPKILLLDEPTNGVDPLSRRDFWELLYGLKEENITMIVTTSYMDEAFKCEQVHLLFDGRTLLEGTPQELLKNQKCETFDELFLKYDSSLSDVPG